MFRWPVFRAAAVARRRNVPGPKQIGLGLAFYDGDRAVMGEGLKQLR
jgi:hypothetical protein